MSELLPAPEESQPGSERRATRPEGVLTDPPDSEEQCPEAMEYVSQLIARMNRPEAAAVAGDRKAAAPPDKKSPRPEPPPATELSTNPKKDGATLTQPALLPRPSVPEPPLPGSIAAAQVRRIPRPAVKSSDLHQLREAANLTANSVLEAYEERSTVRQAYSDLLMAAVSMAASVLLATMSERVLSVAYSCALLTLGQAGWSTWKYIRRTDRLRNRRALDVMPDAPEAA